MEPLRDLNAEAAARGEAPIVLSPVHGPGTAGAQSGRRSARDHQLPADVAERLAASIPNVDTDVSDPALFRVGGGFCSLPLGSGTA